MRLPDKRYTANPEFCGHETQKYIARFCGEWLRDRSLWPARCGFQAPAFDTRAEAVAACVAYEKHRKALLREQLQINARAEFYEANRP